MTPQEFKAWFDGFTEAFTGVPTKAQWARVKERVAEIDGKPVTERVFVDRYWPTYIRQYPVPYWGTTTFCANGSVGSAATGKLYNASNINQMGGQVFCSSQAMADLGRADAKALAS